MSVLPRCKFAELAFWPRLPLHKTSSVSPMSQCFLAELSTIVNNLEQSCPSTSWSEGTILFFEQVVCLEALPFHHVTPTLQFLSQIFSCSNHAICSHRMVFVSNDSSGSIYVSVTNKTGGDANTFTIGARQLENYSSNHWQRSGNETMTVQLSTGKTVTINVGKDDHVTFYDDSYEKVATSVVRFNVWTSEQSLSAKFHAFHWMLCSTTCLIRAVFSITDSTCVDFYLPHHDSHLKYLAIDSVST